MNHSQRVGVAALRPWPFGPPLRGRAPGCYADSLAAVRKVRQFTRRHWPPLGASPDLQRNQ